MVVASEVVSKEVAVVVSVSQIFNQINDKATRSDQLIITLI